MLAKVLIRVHLRLIMYRGTLPLDAGLGQVSLGALPRQTPETIPHYHTGRTRRPISAPSRDTAACAGVSPTRCAEALPRRPHCAPRGRLRSPPARLSKGVGLHCSVFPTRAFRPQSTGKSSSFHHAKPPHSTPSRSRQREAGRLHTHWPLLPAPAARRSPTEPKRAFSLIPAEDGVRPAAGRNCPFRQKTSASSRRAFGPTIPVSTSAASTGRCPHNDESWEDS